ncbi:hypothetical protein [Lederbergia galactosidilytica]|uniref:C2H2-type domain-containing protein n=1 Tax=Lederbergia galactosidilytica TaxID=217031 RepID=A0A177ZQ13_9BACI|nr:hypothetical protein [Lederbergia galactosidilytica]OAK70066.1 hypothetical protein ABB05_12850 [Lederbergia galactosidilytica]
MKTLKNQTIYQCEYCNKRLLSKNGARIHEEQYCWNSPIVKQKRIDVIRACKHEWDTVWDYIPGEAVKEPQYDQCIKCGVTEMEFRRIEESA